MDELQRLKQQVERLTAGPVTLRRGDLVVLESPGRMSASDMERIQAHLASFRQSHGVDFILLTGGLHVARVAKATEYGPDDIERDAESIICDGP
jgi:hypothetical protein